MKKTIDGERLLRATKAFILNSHINNYAVERVAFGFEKPGEQAPIDLYLEHLSLGFDYEPQMRKDIPGIYIDEQERISDKQNHSEYVHDLFVMQMESIFFDAPKDNRLERDGEEIPLPPRFRNYLFGILPLFAEILNVEVEHDAFDVIPTNKEARFSEYPMWVKFVTAILLKPLRSGCRINRYVKSISNAPPYIRRLIENKDKNFFLKPIDVNNCDYILALLSLMNFKNAENGRLLELKMQKWEQQHNILPITRTPATKVSSL